MSTVVPLEAIPPLYQDIEAELEVYYGVDLALTASGRLFLQCDKYRDYFLLETLPAGTVAVVQYGHDQGQAQVIGSIASSRFMLLRNKVQVTVDSTFTMRKSIGALCAYCSFVYNGQDYLWRVKYDMDSNQEKVRHCTLLKNEGLVASFVTGYIEFDSGEKLLGNLFLKCYPSQWPAILEKSYEKILPFVGHHEKDPEADMMLVSFIAVWLRVLKESLYWPRDTIGYA